MAKLDAFYTPEWLSHLTASYLPAELNGVVLDPAMGDGALLRSARMRFGESARIAGIDIDLAAVKRVSMREPDWTLSRADFLHAPSRSSADAWRLAKRNPSAVVLNPPFSSRGAGGAPLQFGEYEGRAGPALHFLATSLFGLRPKYGLVAILPEGALKADRYAAFWSHLRAEFQVDVLDEIHSNSFRGATVSSRVVRVASSHVLGKSRPMTRERVLPSPPSIECRCVDVVRGKLPVFRAIARQTESSDGVPFVHTTSFRSGTFIPTARVSSSGFTSGNLIVVARVGGWRAPVQVNADRVVLSDCVIALRARRLNQDDALLQALDSNADGFKSTYSGTGAKYTTIARLCAALLQVGWHPHVVRPESPQEFGCCGSCSLNRLHPSSIALQNYTA